MHNITEEWDGQERRKSPRLRLFLDGLDHRITDLSERFVALSREVAEMREEVRQTRPDAAHKDRVLR